MQCCDTVWTVCFGVAAPNPGNCVLLFIILSNQLFAECSTVVDSFRCHTALKCRPACRRLQIVVFPKMLVFAKQIRTFSEEMARVPTYDQVVPGTGFLVPCNTVKLKLIAWPLICCFKQWTLYEMRLMGQRFYYLCAKLLLSKERN